MASAEAERAISRRSRSLRAGGGDKQPTGSVRVLDGSADAREPGEPGRHRCGSTMAATVAAVGSGGGGGGRGRGGKVEEDKRRVASAAATAATAATAAATAGAGARLRPIQLAVMGGHTAVLEHLLQAGAAADVEAEDGRQLIHL